MMTKQLLPDEQEIDMALQQNLMSLKEAFCDLLAALILFVVSLFSILHAVLRIAFAVLSLVLWALALFIRFLYWLQSWAVARSSSTLHRR
jgi:glucan phosphoethanolaminetransferase (alkaline phosphatase superfamily)